MVTLSRETIQAKAKAGNEQVRSVCSEGLRPAAVSWRAGGSTPFLCLVGNCSLASPSWHSLQGLGGLRRNLGTVSLRTSDLPSLGLIYLIWKLESVTPDWFAERRKPDMGGVERPQCLCDSINAIF